MGSQLHQRDRPYASTAKRAKPPTSNAASTQLIPLIALSAATEVVSPAIRYANTLLITCAAMPASRPPVRHTRSAGQQAEAEPVDEQRQVLCAVQQGEHQRGDDDAEPRLGDQAAQRLQQVAAKEDLLGCRLDRRGQHDHHKEAPETLLRLEGQGFANRRGEQHHRRSTRPPRSPDTRTDNASGSAAEPRTTSAAASDGPPPSGPRRSGSRWRGRGSPPACRAAVRTRTPWQSSPGRAGRQPWSPRTAVTRAWLTTVVTSRKSERPKTTPSTERHHTYDSPRRICGYAAPSGGSDAALDNAPQGGFGGWRTDRRFGAGDSRRGLASTHCGISRPAPGFGAGPRRDRRPLFLGHGLTSPGVDTGAVPRVWLDPANAGSPSSVKAAAIRASVDCRPSNSIDSNSGGEIRLPVTAARTGPKASRGFSPRLVDQAPSATPTRQRRDRSPAGQPAPRKPPSASVSSQPTVQHRGRL